MRHGHQSVVFVLVVAALLVCSWCVDNTHATSNNNDALLQGVDKWANTLSQDPLDCEQFAQLFTPAGLWSYSPPFERVSTHAQIKERCIKQYHEPFSQLKVFTQKPVISDPHTVALTHTFLYVTNETICRMAVHGVSVLVFDTPTKDGPLAIASWNDYSDHESFNTQWKNCQWPDWSEEEEVKRDAKVQELVEQDPHVLHPRPHEEL
eukprot:TRINITY_DN11774_c0_g1_i1.p1 TRINITY_DN11774_c0_g1~~TRINITY_DN11774_c0_g1_i1.p1  ORF type:complete len:207 (-),score=28.59 TRINITY_DN11774_c0_g1_i1:21-641(-)